MILRELSKLTVPTLTSRGGVSGARSFDKGLRPTWEPFATPNFDLCETQSLWRDEYRPAHREVAALTRTFALTPDGSNPRLLTMSCEPR
jgi:hypothetical protein